MQTTHAKTTRQNADNAGQQCRQRTPRQRWPTMQSTHAKTTLANNAANNRHQYDCIVVGQCVTYHNAVPRRLSALACGLCLHPSRLSGMLWSSGRALACRRKPRQWSGCRWAASCPALPTCATRSNPTVDAVSCALLATACLMITTSTSAVACSLRARLCRG